MYLPARPFGPYLRNLDPQAQDGLYDSFDDDQIPDDGLSSDDDDEDEALGIYSHVDLQKMMGTQMALWCHRSPDTLAIFTPIPGDTLSTAVGFARSTLHCDPEVDRALVLMAGQKKPLDPATIRAVQPGCSVLIVPKYDYIVNFEVSQLNLMLQMVVSVTMTVRQVKVALQRERGYPLDQTDLLFKDQPMENQRHLFDYHVAHDSKIFVMLHLVYDTRVTVETFWGENYEMYVDPCMTTANLLNIVLRRTVSGLAGETSSFFHLILPRHALVMYSGKGTLMQWNMCLGLYGAEDGAVFSLSTIALAHEMSLQSIPVILENGKIHSFTVSKYDYWSVLALKMHGYLGHPINLMRLFHKKHELDLAHAVGPYSYKTSPIRLDMSMLKADKDVYSGISLSFKLGNGVVEVLTCSPTRTVKSVKALLEEVGVPNATAYDLVVDGYNLPESGRIGDVVEEYKKPIDLKLRRYPVFVHAPKSVIYKMSAHAQEALKVFKRRVQLKTGLSQNDYYMLMAGMPITDSDSTPVFQTPLAIGASVFLMALQQKQVFFILCDDWLVKLRLPFQPQPSEIKNILKKDRNVPDGSLASVGNFLQWYFAMRTNNRGLLYDYMKNIEYQLKDLKRQSRPRKRREKEEMWRNNTRQMKQLQHALEKRYDPHQQQDRQNMQPSPVYVHPEPKIDNKGLYYATYTDGQWHRLSPEDIVDSYMRAYSLPPDPAHTSHSRHYNHTRKHHSAMPYYRQRKDSYTRKDPEWMCNLRQMAREEKLEPAYAGLAKRKRRKKKRMLTVKNF